MSTGIEKDNQSHNIAVFRNLSLSIVGGGALGALVGILSGFSVGSGVSMLVTATGGIVGGLISLLVNHQSGKKITSESPP